MRETLVTKLYCAIHGGSPLELTYEDPNKYLFSATNEPSGAYMVESNVFVFPCRECLAPVKRITDATKELLMYATK